MFATSFYNDTVCAGEKMMILIDAHVGGPIELLQRDGNTMIQPSAFVFKMRSELN
jgi:hypothetical protein